MKSSARYAKIIAWSDEDQCYIGTAPGLINGGCHGDDEHQVFEQLCVIVDEAVALYASEGRPLHRQLPAPILQRNWRQRET